MATEAAGKGAKSVGIIARNDAYGRSLAQAVASALHGKGVSVARTGFYVPTSVATSPAVAQVVAAKPGAFVVIGFAEGASIVHSLLQAGVHPDAIVGSPGMYIGSLGSIIKPFDAQIADGLTVVGVGGGEAFDERLASKTNGLVAYGAQSYDCAMIVALAAIQAKSIAPHSIAQHLVSVTTGANACSTFAQCGALLAKGKSISYEGPSGPIKLNRHGNPTSGRIIVGQIVSGSLLQASHSDVPVRS
jgi:branched-chain amino acid transport system substrate-binding protein